jgi:adenylylsulfate kinase
MTPHRNVVLWLTGLSGAGKSTLANKLSDELRDLGCRVTILDGDSMRTGLCSDLGFSPADRHENIRRVAEVAKLFAASGSIVLTALISPLQADRAMARKLIGVDDFLEIHCAASLAVCEQRDVKGLYKKARALEIPEFTGISSPYEAPQSPALTVQTGSLSVTESTLRVMDLLRGLGVLPAPPR